MKGAFPLRSAVEWLLAAALLVGAVWLSSDLTRFWLAQGAEPALAVIAGLPPGVPPGATSVPLLLLLDNREIRLGLTDTEVAKVLGPGVAAAEPNRSEGRDGERLTQLYVDRDTRFLLTLERSEPDGRMRVTGIYLP